MIINENHNMSLFLLLPLIAEEGRDAEYYISQHKNALIDGYAFDVNKPWLDCHISVVFDCELMNKVEVYELANNANFVCKTSYCIGDKYVYSYSLSIPATMRAEYELLMNQNYSKVSHDTTAMILAFWRPEFDSKITKELLNLNKSSLKMCEEILPEEEARVALIQGKIVSGHYLL